MLAAKNRLMTLTMLGLLVCGTTSSPAKAAAEGISIKGRVLDAAGRPLSGATAFLVPGANQFELGERQMAGHVALAPVEKAITGADGRFQVDAAEVGLWHVRVEAAGYQSMGARLSPLLDDVVLPAARLEASRDLVVEVRGAEGKGISGALVVAETSAVGRQARRFWRSSRQGPWSSASLYGRTDDTGRVRFHPAAEVAVKVQAWAPGHLPSQEVEAAGASVRVVLTQGVERTLEVRDAQGRPAAGVLVQVGGAGWPVGWTDEAGRKTVSVAAPDTAEEDLKVTLYSKTAWLFGQTLAMPPRPQGAEALDAAPTEPRPKVFTLPESRSVTVTVVDADSERPVPGAFVWSMGGAVSMGRTDRSGTCTVLIGTEEGQIDLRAGALDFQMGHRGVLAGTARATISLQPAVTLEGRVVDGEGSPLVGADVIAQNRGGSYNSSRGEGSGMVTTDQGGFFRLKGLRPAGSYLVEAMLEGFAPASTEAVTPAAGGVSSEPLEMVLFAGGVVFGVVVDEGEVPVPGARVQLSRTMEGTGWRALVRAFDPRSVATEEQTTDSTGRFEVTQVAAGRYDLSVVAAGFAPVTVRGVEIPSGGGETELGTVILSPGVSLELRVVDAQQLPLAGARVGVHGPRGIGGVFYRGRSADPEREETDLDGRVRLEDLASGSSVTVEVAKEGFQARTLKGIQLPREGPLVVVLGRAFRVSGRLVGPDGEPLPNARAQLFDEQMGISARGRRFGSQTFDSRSHAAEDGSFEIEGVPPGKYTLEGSAQGFRSSLPLELEVIDEDVQGITAALRVGATVRGRVFSAQGTPVAEAWISVPWDPEKQIRRFASISAMTDDSGSYLLEGVEVGELTLRADHQDHVGVTKNLRVQPGENTVNFTLEQGVEVSGRVVTSAGEPVVGARVELRGTDSRGLSGSYAAVSIADGSFRISSVSAGRYRVRAEREGLGSGISEAEIEVSSLPVEGVEVALKGGTTVVGEITGLDFDALSSLQIFAQSRNGGVAAAAVDYRGSYQLGPLGTGVWILQATVALDGRQLTEQMVMEEGVTEMTVDLDFAAGFELRGQVLQGGSPLEGCRVLVQGLDSGASGSGTTDYEGRFRLSNLKAGPYSLSVLHFESGIQHSEEVTVDGDQEVVVELGAAEVSGAVRSGVDGAPLAGVQVELHPIQERPGPAFGLARRVDTDTDGQFSFQGVSEGSWRVVAKKSAFAPAEQNFNVPATGVDGIELTLQPTEGLQVDVLQADGRPATLVEAVLTDQAGTIVGEGRFRLSEQGRFLFDTAPPGRWRLQVSAGRDSADGIATADVPGPPVRVQLPPSGWLSLRVPKLEASGLVAILRLQGADGHPYLALGSQNMGMIGGFPVLAGRLTPLALPPGAWKVTVNAPDGSRWTDTVAIQAGASAELVLE